MKAEEGLLRSKYEILSHSIIQSRQSELLLKGFKLFELINVESVNPIAYLEEHAKLINPNNSNPLKVEGVRENC
jgi:hypothetical protein